MARDLGASIGARLFGRAWVPAPSSTKANDGLGPLYNARSCAACHAGGGRADAGAGKLPAGLVVRLGAVQGRPDPVYGFQIQTQGVPGVTPEAAVERGATGPKSAGLAYGTLDPATRESFRTAPALQGLGLLEGVPDEAIEALAEAQRGNLDGVRGRVHRLPDGRIGRFGWKAGQPTIAAQIASALSIDLGLSTTLAPAPWGDCTFRQTACIDAPHGPRAEASEGRPAIADAIVDALRPHVPTLPAPPPP
ncbi:di-heme oxidoredictase family protein, partial [Nostoc sp. NIES-2111]